MRCFESLQGIGTRWSSCKLVVLVTLGGYHLLDGLVVVVSPWSLQEDCARLQDRDCEGYCARPAGATKSNSSWARREEQQVFRPGQVLELMWTLHVGECDLIVTTSKRTGGNLGACLSKDLPGGNQVNLGIKITMSTLSTLLGGLHSPNHKPCIYIYIYLVPV